MSGYQVTIEIPEHKIRIAIAFLVTQGFPFTIKGNTIETTIEAAAALHERGLHKDG